MNSNSTYKAFTLVELLVVITILTILSTIGFVVFSNYLIGTRDANRIEQLGAILSGLEVYNTKNKLPKPDNSVEVKANGLVIGYQGYMGKNNLGMIGYNKLGIDPKDEQYFTYYLTADKKRFQLMAYLEDENNKQFVGKTPPSSLSFAFPLNGGGLRGSFLIPQVQAADYSKRFPKVVGKKLGILTESGTNLPIQEVYSIISAGYLDVVTTTSSYNAFLTDTDIVSGTGLILAQVNPNSSCKRILEMGGRHGDGVYKISPAGTVFEVYCDMTTDGGGWTLIMNSSVKGDCANFGVFRDCGTVNDFSNPYSINISKLLQSSEVLSYRVNTGTLIQNGFVSKQYLGHKLFGSGLYLINTNIKYLSNDGCASRVVGVDIPQTWQIGVSAIYQTITPGVDTGGGYKGWNWGWSSCQAANICNAGLFKNGFKNYVVNDGCSYAPAYPGGALLIPGFSQAAIFIR